MVLSTSPALSHLEVGNYWLFFCVYKKSCTSETPPVHPQTLSQCMVLYSALQLQKVKMMYKYERSKTWLGNIRRVHGEMVGKTENQQENVPASPENVTACYLSPTVAPASQPAPQPLCIPSKSCPLLPPPTSPTARSATLPQGTSLQL